MASYNASTHSEHAKMEQIITEIFTKSLHIILESRCPYVSSRNYSGEQILSSPCSSTSSSASIPPRDKWFNLALRDCPAAIENIDFWRQCNYEPMVVDVILVHRPRDWDTANYSSRRELVRNFPSKERIPNSWNADPYAFGWEARSEKIIERWVVQYENKKGSNFGSGNKRSICTSSLTLYKKSILLMRSLYATVRLLPAYNLFRELSSYSQIQSYNLAHRVSSSVEPFTSREEADMQRFVFSPIETSFGRLCLSVLYRSSLSKVSSEPSTPISPQVISDYVGSPMADPLKRFPSIPVSQFSPSDLPFERRHSWSFDLYRGSPTSALPSPSPTYSEPRATISKCSFSRLPPTGLPSHPAETPQAHTKNTSFDEYWPSPTFSPSPSPSPPACILGVHASKALFRTESDPVSIHGSKFSHILVNKQVLPPSPPFIKVTGHGVSKLDKASSGTIRTSSSIEKIFIDGKHATGKISVMKLSSNSSPQKSLSPNSSRLSFQDDYDDSEFSGPFVVDYDDLTDLHSRPGSFDPNRQPCDSEGIFAARKSQDAAVGALVHMLKRAPPLRQDSCDSVNSLHSQKPEMLSKLLRQPNKMSEEVQGTASLHVSASKTTADALEELRSYREMKDMLLEHDGRAES